MAAVSLEQLQQSAGYAVQQARQAMAAAGKIDSNHQSLRAELARMQQDYVRLQGALQSLQLDRGSGDPSVQRVENIPGRRVPFDMLVDIPIPSTATGTVTGTITISQDGPFVAVARSASLLSAYSFMVPSGQGQAAARFQGRSFGRYRPIHSAWDLNDGIPRSQVTVPLTAPSGIGGDPQAFMDRVSNSSGFRTMQGDFRIHFENQGSSYPRQNLEVPSTMWTRAINSPWELAALDFFERGEVFTFKVTPQHPANPPYGNVNGFMTGASGFPSLDSQWDYAEGVLSELVASPATDPVIRSPDAILTIGFHGYRIIQPPGVQR